MKNLSILLIGQDSIGEIKKAIPKEATILEAPCGHEAIFQFSRHDPDLVIAACNLSPMSGIEVATAIHSIAPDAQVVLVAENFDSETYAQAVEAGIMHFMELARVRGTMEIFLRNVLHRVRTRRKLQAGQNILEHILKGFPHAALLIDWNSMNILSSNNAAKEIGYSSGNSCEGFLFPGGWRESVVKSLLSGADICHSEIIFDYGIWKTTSVLTSGKTVFFMAENITDATLAQERIQQSENLLSAIFDNSYDAIFLFDATHHVFKANKRVQDMFGHQLTDTSSLVFEDLLQLAVPREDENSERFNAALKGVSQLFETKCLHADGTTAFDVEIFLRGLVIDGCPMVLATIRDVTERRRAEVDFISIQRQLGEHLIERKVALTDLSERLRLELSKCDMLQEKMGVAQESYKQVIATARNDMPTVQSFHLAYGDLSSRELQVIMQLAKGISVSTIAEEMRLSPKTVSTYKRRAMKKLNLSSESELILYALRTGLMS